MPPGHDLSGVNAGTGDYIGIYSSVAAADATCAEQAEPGLGRSPEEIAEELAHRPGLLVTARVPVSVGGLDGVVFDLRLADGWDGACPFAPGLPVVPMIIGRGQSGLHHVMIGGVDNRLYLLDRSGESLAIEVNDVSGGGHLDTYSAIIEQMKFGG